jgi:plasmid replication initiation protein
MKRVNEEKILCKPSGIISINADLTAIQRKAYNVFLYYAKCAYIKNPAVEIITIPLQELKNMIGDKSTDNKRIKENLIGIRSAHVEFNSLGKDSAAWSDIALLSEIHILIKNGIGIVAFALPPTIKKNIIYNFLYAKIDLLILKNLKSKYAIILYELIKDYQNVQIPKMNVEECKKLFGCAGKYEGITNQFKKYVLDPACSEINNNPDINCKISYEAGKDEIRFKFKFKSSPDEKEETSAAPEIPMTPTAVSEAPIKLPAVLPVARELDKNPDDFVSLGEVFKQYFNKKSKGI